NYRLKTGATDLSSLSMHSFGRAIDINTLCNPWVKTKADGTKILDPAESVDPATRDPSQPTPECSITRDTELGRAVIEAFSSHGWQWGGDWNNPKDFQHFQNPSADHETQVKRAPFCK
ncbi:MAG: M15 family metallopeptidase, partial [Bdellovibrionota bacterium]